jgi:SAM-dependent methyltransferase
MNEADRNQVRALAETFLTRGKPLEWFDVLYASAGGNAQAIPWADQRPNHNLVTWLDREHVAARGRALVIGCGLGDDAEELARRGWNVTAFDIAPTAVTWCRRRFPGSKVDYTVADLLDPPQRWKGAFDFVLESYTLQAIPAAPRAKGIARLPGLLAPGGKLLIICRGRDENDPPGDIPWPLLRSELSPLAREFELSEESFEDYLDPGVGQEPPTRRFRAVYQRPR